MTNKNNPDFSDRAMSNELRNELDNLYKLQATAKSLTHGIVRKGEWTLFEPPKFIYAFFAFNSFYSIDWQLSVGKQSLVKYDRRNYPDEKGEYKKFYHMHDFIFHDGSNETDTNLFSKRINDFLSRCTVSTTGEDAIQLLKEVVPDKKPHEKWKPGVNQNMIDNFRHGFNRIVQCRCQGEEFKTDLRNVIFFIYQIRNNIFHGTKTILMMMKKDPQARRIGIYSAILLALNETLFDAIERDFHSWKRDQIDDRLLREIGQ